MKTHIFRTELRMSNSRHYVLAAVVLHPAEAFLEIYLSVNRRAGPERFLCAMADYSVIVRYKKDLFAVNRSHIRRLTASLGKESRFVKNGLKHTVMLRAG